MLSTSSSLYLHMNECEGGDSPRINEEEEVIQ